MNAFGWMMALVALWALWSPASFGEHIAEIVQSYRKTMEKRQ